MQSEVARPSSLSSSLALTEYRYPHFGHTTSLCRPINVGAIEPVGITNASASNVRNRNASTNAITIDSTVSRIACDWMGCAGAGADLAVALVATFGTDFGLGMLVE